jgi:2-keto-4-pentenoate hydratase/2-oxohepta-3-ene-1,7-dioic acid hydratase in catechol pathway
MRLVTFTRDGGSPRAGALVGGDRFVVDLALAHQGLFREEHPAFASLQALIEGGDDAFDRAVETVKRPPEFALTRRTDATLLAPLQPPPQMRDCMCFETHVRQSYAAARKIRARAKGQDGDPGESPLEQKILGLLDQQPLYYKGNRFSVIGTDHDVVWPAYSNALDFELEFGCYIKKPTKDVPVEKARDCIFGYTIFNDFSARDTQSVEMVGQLGPAKSKDFDTGSAMGPCLVTADELRDPYNLEMVARVDGEEWGRGNSRTMRWTFEDLIAFISRSETLYPGEFLGSGTVGNGCGLEHLRFLKPGNVVELEVESIGVLRNRVVRNG